MVELIRSEQRVFMRSFFNWVSVVDSIEKRTEKSKVYRLIGGGDHTPSVEFYKRSRRTRLCSRRLHSRLYGMRSLAISSDSNSDARIPYTSRNCLRSTGNSEMVQSLFMNWNAQYASKGRLKEAKEAERRISNLSGKKCESVQTPSCERNYTAMDLLQNRQLATRTAILCSLWFSTSLSAYGSDLNSGNLHGNFYVNQIASAMTIAFTKIFVFLLDTYCKSFDRRKLHQVPQVLMITCYSIIMCLQMFVPEENCDGNSWKDWMS
ncbi:hypothetical protein COOONC_20505 [Cooperia oncophora]